MSFCRRASILTRRLVLDRFGRGFCLDLGVGDLYIVGGLLKISSSGCLLLGEMIGDSVTDDKVAVDREDDIHGVQGGNNGVRERGRDPT